MIKSVWGFLKSSAIPKYQAIQSRSSMISVQNYPITFCRKPRGLRLSYRGIPKYPTSSIWEWDFLNKNQPAIGVAPMTSWNPPFFSQINPASRWYPYFSECRTCPGAREPRRGCSNGFTLSHNSPTQSFYFWKKRIYGGFLKWGTATSSFWMGCSMKSTIHKKGSPILGKLHRNLWLESPPSPCPQGPTSVAWKETGQKKWEKTDKTKNHETQLQALSGGAVFAFLKKDLENQPPKRGCLSSAVID